MVLRRNAKMLAEKTVESRMVFFMEELIRYTKKILMRGLLSPIKVMPIRQNQVMLVNDLSRKFSDNPKVVALALEKKFPGKFKLVVAVNDPSVYGELTSRGIKVVKFNSIAYFYFGLTSKVFLTNSGGFSYLPIRKQQYVINTWHGGGAYKKCGTDMYNNTKIFRKNLRLQGDHTSVFLSTCRRFTEEVSRAMLVPKEVFWEIGMPRNDILIHGDSVLRQVVREKVGLREGEKLILFAPTYRKINDNYFNDSVMIDYGVDAKRVCKAMERRFGEKWRFAVRYHPCVVNRVSIKNSDILDLTDYEDMQELLLAADAMINDFSSSMWDFMFTGRPSFLFAVDLDHYISTTEVYTPVSEWPFPKAVNNDELEKNILEFDEEEYADACKSHYEALGGCETGKATELVCQRIYDKCFG